MSTTRTTLSTHPSHTVVGRTPSNLQSAVHTSAVVLLNRSSRLLRREYLKELIESGIEEIVSVEAAERSYTVEPLSREFTQARFILVDEPITFGEAINLAVQYVHAPFFTVLWSTMGIPSGVSKAIDAIEGRRVCVAPLLRGERGETLPTAQAPALHKGVLKILPLPVRGDGSPTIFPTDYVGTYSKRRFQELDGFDAKIDHPFWQKLDFGFRVHVAGGDIPIVPTFRASYRSMPEPEDQTINESYARFYAKNLAVRVSSSGGKIPFSTTITFALRARMGLFSVLSVFRDVRIWLLQHGSMVRTDPRDIVEGWSIDHE